MKIFITIGKRIKEERLKKGLTQENLAELVGVSNNFISYIETGKKKASLNTIAKIADVLEVTLSDLFKGVTPKKKKKKKDYTTEQINYLIKDELPDTKKMVLELCKTLVKKKKKKKKKKNNKKKNKK